MYYDDEELTPEEENQQYLDQNLAVECGLWAEWVGVVCGYKNIPRPSATEWGVLKAGFYPGKTPDNSVNDLINFRKKNEYVK